MGASKRMSNEQTYRGLHIYKITPTFYKVSGYCVDIVKREFDNKWIAWAWEPFTCSRVGYGANTWHERQKLGFGRWHCLGVFDDQFKASLSVIPALNAFIETLSQNLSPLDLRAAGYRFGSEPAHEH